MKLKTMQRRAFLQGLGGFGLSIPFLSSLAPREALAASAPPMRFVCWINNYGRDIHSWYPTAEASTRTPDGSAFYSPLGNDPTGISPILGSDFNSVRQKLSVLRGLDGMQARSDGHSAGMVLTGSGWANGRLGFGYSLDAILEESSKFYARNPQLGALRFSGMTTNGFYISSSFTSRSGTLVRIAPESRVMDIYEKYFSPRGQQRAQVVGDRMKPVTNMVMDDFKATIGSRRISSEDKQKLDNYMSLLNQAEKKLGLTNAACGANPPSDSALTNALVLHQTAMDLEVAALACGMTQIAVHCNVHNSSDLKPNDLVAHAAAHSGQARDASGNVVLQSTLNKWHMSRVADMLKKLDSVAESDGSTLLDNTFFIAGNVESRGFHNFNDMPIIVAGAKDKLRTGLYIDYRPRPLRVLSNSQSVVAGRPINALIVTAFQALGLKPEDYQRFNRPGFGIYDQFPSDLASHYAPFIGSRVNDPLPFLYKG